MKGNYCTHSVDGEYIVVHCREQKTLVFSLADNRHRRGAYDRFRWNGDESGAILVFNRYRIIRTPNELERFLLLKG